MTKILLEKILAPVPSSTSPLAGDKNEIVVDFRLGFTESERNNIYFTAGDIFSELGGLAASFKLIWSIVGTITVLRFMYDFSEMIKRKGSHKFRVITIEKYKKCFPQILAIIAEKTKNLHDTSDPEYNNYLEDKESIEQIKRAQLKTYKQSTQAYDMQRYLINKYSHQHKIDIPIDNERNMLIKLWD